MQQDWITRHPTRFQLVTTTKKDGKVEADEMHGGCACNSRHASRTHLIPPVSATTARARVLLPHGIFQHQFAWVAPKSGQHAGAACCSSKLTKLTACRCERSPHRPCRTLTRFAYEKNLAWTWSINRTKKMLGNASLGEDFLECHTYITDMLLSTNQKVFLEFTHSIIIFKKYILIYYFLKKRRYD